MNYQPYTDTEDFIDAVEKITDAAGTSMKNVWFVESYRDNERPKQDIYIDEDENQYLPVFALQIGLGTRLFREPLPGYPNDFDSDAEYNEAIGQTIDDLEDYDVDYLCEQLGDNVFIDWIQPVRNYKVTDRDTGGKAMVIERPIKFVYCEPLNEED